MDLQILSWAGEVGSFSFTNLTTVEGIEQLKQTVLVEFLSLRSESLGNKTMATDMFSEIREETAAAIADEIVANINTNIIANQSDVIRPDERLSEVNITSFSKSTSGGWHVVLRITSEDGTETETESVL